MAAEDHLQDEQFGKPKEQWEHPDPLGSTTETAPFHFEDSNKDWTMEYQHHNAPGADLSQHCGASDPHHPSFVCGLPQGHESPHVGVVHDKHDSDFPGLGLSVTSIRRNRG